MAIKDKRSWIIKILAPFIVPVLRLRMGQKIMGAENIPTKGPCIIASNHVTACDPIYIGSATKRGFRYMAKEELFRNKLIGAFLRAVGAFPVARGSGGMDALDTAEKYINEGKGVCIFIEGTRSKTGELLKPKMGAAYLAFRAKVPVVPVAIAGENGEVPRKGGRMRVNIGKPISFEELQMEEASGMHYRRGSRVIMERISALRDEAIADMEKSK